jgi:integrase
MNWVEPIRSKSKINLIKDHLRTKRSPRDYLFFVLGINVALRISDLLRIKVSDVRDEDGRIRDALVVVEKKTKKRRSIPLEGAAKDALEWYFERMPDAEQDDWLFKSTQREEPIHRVQARRLVKRWCDLVGLEGNYATHSLRKTWGYMARKSGLPVSLIRQALGHSREEITLQYLGITAEEVEDVYRKVNL